jgi:MAE_28990/MAE_18760-like HEPN
MRRLRTRAAFQEFLDKEFAWRLKEIADINESIRTAEPTSRKSLIRAGIPILYAHWEGFVKAASEAILNFISNQGLPYRTLKPCFIVFGAKKQVRDIGTSGSAAQNIAAVEFFLNELDSRAEIAFLGSINTDANLSSTVFERIATSIGVNTGAYETKYVLIDKSLVERRNNIAHGEFLDVDREDFGKLTDEVIVLLRFYKNDLQNMVQTSQYLN